MVIVKGGAEDLNICDERKQHFVKGGAEDLNTMKQIRSYFFAVNHTTNFWTLTMELSYQYRVTDRTERHFAAVASARATTKIRICP